VEALIAKVTRIHAQVRGHTADGRAYSADDPALLTWVHVTEAYGFLQGCRRYCRDVPTAVADQYYREYKRVAEALGAVDVPASEAEVDAYFARQQSQRKANHSTAMRQHPFNSEMRLAGIGRPQHRSDIAATHSQRQIMGRELVHANNRIPGTNAIRKAMR